ncbi:phage baseplate assembly protein V [Sebaldella sp. S0638]|uniref:phage baseplate assembly protein V n=1 Tax=Sebaldella sp. S0638 TaxID=2957809 RepID=UPI0020A07335|nr:phage baseplate assembly protein V [Sebaldella sp. S0638]MCP1225931.1 phage baseplate assembly protein V [Sebaldella sp. S0638]
MREKKVLDLNIGADIEKKEEESGNSLEGKISGKGNTEIKSNETGSVLERSLGESGKTSVGETLLGGLAGSTMTEAFRNMMKSPVGTVGSNTMNGSGIVESMEQIKAPVLYRGKNIRLWINEELMDIKDVEMNITKEVGKHDYLFMKFTIKTEEVSKYYSYVFSFDNLLEVDLAESEMKFKRVFHGLNIEKIEIEESTGERSVVIIKSLSCTYQMDKIKKFKSFQSMGITYKDIVTAIMENYPEIELFAGSELNGSLKKPYIQYNETDWEFLNRIAGDLNIPVFSHLNSIIMGNKINLMEEEAELRNSVYGKSRDGVNIMFNVKKSTQPVNAGQRMIISVPNQGYNGEEGKDIRIVSKAYIRMDGDQVITDYELIQESHEFYPVSHSTLEGKSIEGTVMEVVSEDGIAKMKVDLSVGLMKAADSDKSEGYEDEYKGGFNFPYMTGFSSSNTGFFCVPEKGDQVMLVFNSRNESYAYILQGAVNSSGNDRFNNPNVRNYTLGGDDSAGGKPMFEFQLSSKVFNVNVTDSINMNAKNKISNISENGIEIAGKSNVSIVSNEEMIIISNNLREMVGSDKIVHANNSNEVISGTKNTMSSDCNMGTSGVMSISGGGDVIINKG